MSHYRPWGPLQWLLSGHLAHENWALLGCLSTGERSLAAWRALRISGRLGEVKLLRILNKPSRFDSEISRREDQRVGEFTAEGGNVGIIERHALLAPPSDMVDIIQRFLHTAGSNVILDVSSMPERFFFPLLKLLLKGTETVSNLIVTYTFPAGYTQEKLGENLDPWDHLPLFSGSYTVDKPKMLIINVGFEGFGLQDQVDHGEAGLPIKLLFPFPAPPQSFRRSWELVRRLQKHRLSDSFETYRTDAKEVSDPFERLLSLTDRGNRRAILAPFGPKPISVAMCIFATRTESPVFYTQPKVYHSNYSYGVAEVAGVPAIWAYCLRLNGREYYEL